MRAACRVTRDRKKRKKRPAAGFLFVWSRGTCGFTLNELLMSIAIMAFLFAAGVGTYWRMTRGHALRAGISTIESALHGARALAIHERSPADLMVVERQVDPPPALPQVERLYVVGKRTVSCWHFEEKQLQSANLSGALGQGATVRKTDAKDTTVTVTVPGRIGRALPFNGRIYVQVGTTPYLEGIRDGVFVEALVWPDPTGPTGDLVVAVLGNSSGTAAFSLLLTPVGAPPTYRLKGRVRTTAGTPPEAQTDAVIPASEWTHVALAYNPIGTTPGLVLLVNGAELATAASDRPLDPLTPNTGQLYLGGYPPDSSLAILKGCLDEVKVAATVKGEVQLLPKNTVVTREGATALDSQDKVSTPILAVRFDDEGKLDAPSSPKPIARFFVDSPSDGLRRVVQVGRVGRIEVLDILDLVNPLTKRAEAE